MPSIFDLVGQLSFYGTYHTDSRNKAIHIIFVPVILWTALVWFSYTGPVADIHLTGPFAHLTEGLVFNAAFFVASIYAIYYVLLERNIAGFVAAGLLWIGWITATSFYESNPENAWKIALGFHLLGWATQFIGHGVFENRKPALFDNLVNALLLAPLFVFLEVLFLFGYRPSLAYHFHQSVLRSVAKLNQTKDKSKGKKAQTKKSNDKKATSKTPAKTQSKTPAKPQSKSTGKTQAKTPAKSTGKTPAKPTPASKTQAQKGKNQQTKATKASTTQTTKAKRYR